jgi:hypothetical protein
LKFVLSLVIFIMLVSTAWGQFSGQLMPAGTVLKGSSEGGGYFGIYEDARGLVGSYRFGISGYTDFGARVGFIDFDAKGNNDTGFLLSGDIKYQVMEVRIMDPLDLSVGGIFETILGVGNNLFSIGGYVTGSYPIELKSGRRIYPYGRMIFRMEWYEKTDTDFDPGLNLGASMELNESTSASAEIQFDDYFGLMIGLVFGF